MTKKSSDSYTVSEAEIFAKEEWTIHELAQILRQDPERVRKHSGRNSVGLIRTNEDGTKVFNKKTAWTIAKYFNTLVSKTPSLRFEDTDSDKTYTVLATRVLTSRFHIEARQDNSSGEVSVEVVKTTNGDPIPADEPLFLLRARDALAASLLLCYRALIEVTHYPDPAAKQEHLYTNDKTRTTFEVFAHEHSERMKLPNITRGK